MTGIRQYVAVLCALLVAAPAGGFAADPQQPQPAQPGASAPPPAEPAATRKTGVVGWVTNPYRPVTQPSNSLADSTRLESLLRAGNLYLSLQDTIALALENNLDIAIERYGPMLADAALRQAEGGGLGGGGFPGGLWGAFQRIGLQFRYHGRDEQQRGGDLQQRFFQRRGRQRPLRLRTGDPQPGPDVHRRLELGPFDHAADQRVPDRHQFAHPEPGRGQLRNPAGLPHRYHGQPRVEQYQDGQQQPAQRFQPGHELVAQLRLDAAPVAGFRLGRQLAANPHRQEQSRGQRHYLQ